MLPPTPHELERVAEFATAMKPNTEVLDILDLPVCLVSRKSSMTYVPGSHWIMNPSESRPHADHEENAISSNNSKRTIADPTLAKHSQDFDGLSDLISSAASDLWSHNDTALSVNLTSIMEDSDDKEIFLTPHDLLIESLPKLTRVSPSTNIDITSTPVRRGSESSAVTDTPCKKLASKIEVIDSPFRDRNTSARYDVLNTHKVWTPDLDEELLRCWNKYKTYKASHPDPSIFKYTTRNKILSRMLLNKISVFRTPKQVSARLQRLLKYKADEREGLVRASEQPVLEYQHTIPPSESYSNQPQSNSLDHLHILEFCLAFQYEDYLLGKHIFALLSLFTEPEPSYESFSVIAKTIHHRKFLQELTDIAPKLVSQDIPIHNVLCNVNLDVQPDSSSPLSPHANSRLVNLRNGHFQAFTKMQVPGSGHKGEFLAWRSILTVYKGLCEVLLTCEDAINGYRNQSQDYILQIPFLTSFWAGYLSFLLNGSRVYQDLKDLTILQVICDGELGLEKVYGYFIYNFSPGQINGPALNVSVFKLLDAPTGNSADDNDEVETILAPSSPITASPSRSEPFKPDMRVDVGMATLYSIPGPSTAPVFDSRAIQMTNSNYNNQRPGPAPLTSFHASKSTTNVNESHNYISDNRPNMTRHFSSSYVPPRSKSEFNGMNAPPLNLAMNAVPANSAMNSIPANSTMNDPISIATDQNRIMYEQQQKQYNMMINHGQMAQMEPELQSGRMIDNDLNLEMSLQKIWSLNTQNIQFESPAIHSAPATRERFFSTIHDPSEASNDAGQVLKQVHNHTKMAASRANRRGSQSFQAPVNMQVVPSRMAMQNQPTFNKFSLSQPLIYKPKN